MKFSHFTLFVALVITCVAEYFSIIGLTTIFAGAFWPIVIMGVCLGVGKITATTWLKLNWDRAPLTYKLYLVPSVFILMFLTSIGSFGFLSKAHSEASLVGGDVQSKIAIYDEKIQTAKGNIDANRKALKQMDESVDQVMARSSSETGADKAVGLRRSQQKERARLQSEIQAEQKTISSLSEERAPIAAEVRKVEADVGPIKYIAAIIYGDNPDANLLEAAVRWVIIIIVAVFDPLALMLLLAAQQSMRWERQRDEEEALAAKQSLEVTEKPVETQPNDEDEQELIEQSYHEFLERGRLIARELDRNDEQIRIAEANSLIDEIEKPVPEVEIPVSEVVVPKTQEPPSDPTIECFKCGTELVDAPGIGLFCPNKACDVVDGPFSEDEEPITFTYIPPASLAKSIEEPVDDIDTENVTEEKILFNPNEGHVTFDGKKMSIDNLRGIRPDLIMPADGSVPNRIDFGTEFPKLSLAGDSYIRIDSVPHRVYKFNGKKWITVEKSQNTTYLTNLAYLRFLIQQLEQNGYDPELLTYAEQDEIEAYLTKKNR